MARAIVDSSRVYIHTLPVLEFRSAPATAPCAVSGAVVNPIPFGVTFSGPAFSEPRLLALAYAFEQATHYRVPPSSVPPLATDHVVK